MNQFLCNIFQLVRNVFQFLRIIMEGFVDNENGQNAFSFYYARVLYDTEV